MVEDLANVNISIVSAITDTKGKIGKISNTRI
ncbi:hypothetical protein ICE98_03089 [Lactococcus lactis]|nr:hypothetical protein [Lactococcus lactis]